VVFGQLLKFFGYKEFFRKYKPVNGGSNIVVIPKSTMREDAEEILRTYGKIK
jgi:hypothetical protein